MTTQPTSITDKNGKQTTVYKNIDKDAAKNVSRVAVVSVDALKSSDVPTCDDQCESRLDCCDCGRPDSEDACCPYCWSCNACAVCLAN